MKAKNVLLVLLGMSSSFTVIFALLVALSHEPTPRATRPGRPVPPVRMKTDRGEVRRPVIRSRETTEVSEPSSATTAAVDTALPPVAKKDPSGHEAWRDRQRQFEAILEDIGFERSVLQQQLTALERDRSRMVSELAKELSTSEPMLAVEELVVLDDETAALVLKKMPNNPRVEVLSLLEPKRARLLRGRIKRL